MKHHFWVFSGPPETTYNSVETFQTGKTGSPWKRMSQREMWINSNVNLNCKHLIFCSWRRLQHDPRYMYSCETEPFSSKTAQLKRLENFQVLPPVALEEVRARLGLWGKWYRWFFFQPLRAIYKRLELSVSLFYWMKFARLGSLIPLGVSAFNNSLFKDCSEGHALAVTRNKLKLYDIT